MPEQAHLQQLAQALEEERAWQEREHRSALRLPLEDRVAMGLCWSPVTVMDVEPAGRGTLITLRAPHRGGLHDGISPGDRVEVAGHDGLCWSADDTTAEIRLDGEVELTGQVAVTRRFDPTTFRRAARALETADAHRSILRSTLLGERAPPEVAPRDHAALRSLNTSQQEAARLALGAESLALVHGPPGTGKTTLVVALLRVLCDTEDRAWALADSNAAVDHLALRAAAAGLRVVRVGHPSRIGPLARPLSLHDRMEKSPVAPALRELDRELRALRGKSGRGLHAQRRALYRERDALVAQAREAVLASAQVIAVTLGTLARVGPTLPPAATAIIDEATQALEPSIWVAVPLVDRLILVGDPHQLGPVVFSPQNPLQRSILERLLEETEVPLPMLEIQHRMHQTIQDRVEPVYGDTYLAHDTVAAHLLAELPGVTSAPETTTPFTWVDTVGAALEEQRDPVTRSLFNPGEIRLVTLAVERLLACGVQAPDIGVVAPYSAQVRRLRSALPEAVEVATVNAFQGREKEVVVCSFTRSNPDGNLGFVADRRRLTVALTRARRCLICVGDSGTLGTEAAFAELVDDAQCLGTWQTIWDEPWNTTM